MTVAEFTSWIAFYESEPFGDVRADLRSGIVASVVARTMGGKRNAKPLDFMPIVAAQRDRAEREMTQRERNAQFRQAFEANLGPIRVRHSKIRRPRVRKANHG